MIRVVLPGSRNPDADILLSRIQGSKRHRIPDPDPQHCSTQFIITNLVGLPCPPEPERWGGSWVCVGPARDWTSWPGQSACPPRLPPPRSSRPSSLHGLSCLWNVCVCSMQCCGTGSVSDGFGPHRSRSISTMYGSGCRFGSGSLYLQAKIVRKTLIPTVLWLLYDFFIFEKWCKCSFNK